MRLATGTPRLVAVVAFLVAVGGCATAAAPTASPTTASFTAGPTAAPLPSPTPSLAPSPTVAIVKISPIPAAPDSKLVLHLIAEGGKWDKTTLAAPAGSIWHITVVSQEPIGHHNFVVASGKTFEERIYTGKNLLPKATVTYDIPALPAGSYFFICTVHPETMTGTLVLK